ncbi:MAG TPA: metal-dependent transcriptional regulator [Acidimicrobiales bacterium]|nr:metal-dependent transcriptional regulator [Acidimicrobiales bacterium]
MPEGFHPPLEEYLETIYSLMEEHVPVIQARLVERLHHSPQAVSEMVHRLIDEGYVERSGRGLELTAKGRTRAESVVRKHRIAERFLVDVVGLPWYEAHHEAGRWEHVISDEVEARFVAILDNPTTCPHGNPIPGTAPDPVPQRPLTEIAEGTSVVLVRITELVEFDRDALVYLSDHGLVPGRRARIRNCAPDGTLTLELGGADAVPSRTVAVGPALGRQLFVTTI